MKKFTWIWLVLTLLISAVIIWASLKFSKIDQAIYYLDSKGQRVIVEKQPIYTTIQGLPGLKGDPGQDSVSTHTIVEKETTIIQQQAIQGDKGETGEAAKQVEFGMLNGLLVYRYIGDRQWLEIPVVGGNNE